ncbi:MAG: error-prone DNA polymerase, partial [Planctomycetales bacterium]|nr:error-prone DNA polymerase [Planctomycetales bacterium]
LRLIHGLAESDGRRVGQLRGDQPFGSMEEFTQRTGLSRAVIMRLSQADVFASLGRNRRESLWEALAQERISKQPAAARPLFALLTPEDDPLAPLPEPQPLEQVFADYDATGLSLKAHPISFYRSDLQRLRVIPADQLATHAHDSRVRVAGLVLLRQRPSTAKGITFVTLEDETGTMNLVVHQKTWEQYYATVRRSPAWLAEGRLEIRQSIIHIVVHRVQDLAHRLKQLNLRSRDFR